MKPIAIEYMREIITDIVPENHSLIPFSITNEKGCTDHHQEHCWHVFIEVSTKRDCYEIYTGDESLTRALSKAIHRLRREIPVPRRKSA